MSRITPIRKMGRKVEQVMTWGLDGVVDITTTVIRLGIERIVQEMLEQEIADYLARERYQRRRPEREQRSSRNG